MARFLQPLGPVIYRGPDVSELQGEIDFLRVRSSGSNAVYIRAGVGSDHADAMLDPNYEKARAAGLLTGFFHQLTARTAAEARQEMDFFLSLIAGKRSDLLLAVEYTYFDGLTGSQASTVAAEALETLRKKSGLDVILAIRTGEVNNLWTAVLADAYPLWAIEPGAALPDGNITWKGWTGFRFSGTGRTDGISGPVNLNRFTRGIRLREAALIAGTPSDPPKKASKLICHTVAWGDTLWSLARRYSTTVDALVLLNDIADRNLIYPGQRLYIAVPTGFFGACCDRYTIRRGDRKSVV